MCIFETFLCAGDGLGFIIIVFIGGWVWVDRPRRGYRDGLPVVNVAE